MILLWRLFMIVMVLLVVAGTINAQEANDIHPSAEAQAMYESISGLPISGVLDCAQYETARTVFQALRLLVPSPAGVAIEAVDIEGVPGAWFIPDNSAQDSPVIFYLHGGGYIAGSLEGSYRSYVARLALHSGMRVFAVDYRLAPENPYPAALEDSLTAYHWLLTQVDFGQVFIAGDSAGGNLALITLFALRESGEAMPAGLILLSPWLDLTLSGTTITTMADYDAVLSPEGLTNNAACYAGEMPLDNPMISPLFGAFNDLPPILVQVGTYEILLADSTRFVRRARVDGADITLDVWDGMIHVWPLYNEEFPEGIRAFEEIGTWVRQIAGG